MKTKTNNTILMFLLLYIFLFTATQAQIANTKQCDSNINTKYWDNCNGTYVDQFGVSFTGEWRKGNITSDGVIDFPDGRKYVGSIKNGTISGKGVVYDEYGSVVTSGTYSGGQFISSDGNTKPLSRKSIENNNVNVNVNVNASMSVESGKTKCQELGFTPATESFGKCVLQLTK